MRSMRRDTCLIVISVLLTFGLPADADVIVNFSGVVVASQLNQNANPTVHTGDTFLGSFSYDPVVTEIPITIFRQNSTQFAYLKALRSFHLEANGSVLQSFTFDPIAGPSDGRFSSSEIDVVDEFTGLDDLFVAFMFEQTSQTVLNFLAPGPSVIENSSLPGPFPSGWSLGPANPGPLDLLTASTITAWNGDPNDFSTRFSGVITTINSVPEPSALTFLGLGGLTMLRRRMS